MMKLHKILFLFFSLLMSVSILAQDTSCNDLVKRAFSAIGENCNALDRNTVCYGYNRVAAEFSEKVADDYFTAPADRVSLTTLEMLRTSALDETEDEWGIAVMNLLANMPETLPGQSVTFILLGDNQLENAVSAEEVNQNLAQQLEVKTLLTADVRSGPDLSFNAMGTVPPDISLQADGLDKSGDWVHVYFEGNGVWIGRILLLEDSAIEELPLYDETTLLTGQTPMQAFYLETGIGTSGCVEAPHDGLLVQGPQQFTVNITVNGAEIEFGSTLFIRTVDENLMELTVIDGHATLPDSGLTIEEGQQATVPLERNADGQLEVAGDWNEPEAVPQETVINSCTLRGLPENLLNYPIRLQGASGLTHLVQAGDNLYRIALQYNIPMGAIAQANQLTDWNTIPLGRNLIIPNYCPGDPVAAPPVGVATPLAPLPTPLPGVVPSLTPVPENGVCGGFRLTSPLGGTSAGPNDFYWDPAPGAAYYVLTFYNANGAASASYTIRAPQTTYTVDTGELALGGQYAWSVDAYNANQGLLCSDRTGPLVHGEPVNPIVVAAPSASWACSNIYEVQVNYTVPAGTTSIEFNFMANATPVLYTQPAPPLSGSFNYVGFGPTTFSSGTIKALPSNVQSPITPAAVSC